MRVLFFTATAIAAFIATETNAVRLQADQETEMIMGGKGFNPGALYNYMAELGSSILADPPKKEEAKKEEVKKDAGDKKDAPPKKDDKAAAGAEPKKEEGKKEEGKKEEPKKEEGKPADGAKKEDAKKEGDKEDAKKPAADDEDEEDKPEPKKPNKVITAEYATVGNPRVERTKDGVTVIADVNQTNMRITSPDDPKYSMIHNMSNALKQHIPHAIVSNNYGPSQQVAKDMMTVRAEDAKRRIEEMKENKRKEAEKKKAEEEKKAAAAEEKKKDEEMKQRIDKIYREEKFESKKQLAEEREAMVKTMSDMMKDQ